VSGEREPRIGDQVHYLPDVGDHDAGPCQPAHIVCVREGVTEGGLGIVDVTVLDDARQPPAHQEVPHVRADRQVGDTWHWSCR
jgi:hypothetical protein